MDRIGQTSVIQVEGAGWLLEQSNCGKLIVWQETICGFAGHISDRSQLEPRDGSAVIFCKRESMPA
ncbi:hypothetical protein ACVWZ4_000815 [Bradyrhizobium sp. USDA 4472]